MNVDQITRPAWETTYYLTDTGGRSRVDLDDEAGRVAEALDELHARGILPHTDYDGAAFERLRAAVKAQFEVPWTSITPVMERLLYALPAILQPRCLCCCGIFAGNTLIWNVGAATGPGAVYDGATVVGCEVVPEHVDQARRNLAAIGAPCDIRCQDGHETVASLGPIDYLYLDANGPNDHPDERRRGKRIYTTLLEAAEPYLAPGALIVAHDTVPDWFARSASCYFALCRDRTRFRHSVEVRIDEMGVEVTQR